MSVHTAGRAPRGCARNIYHVANFAPPSSGQSKEKRPAGPQRRATGKAASTHHLVAPHRDSCVSILVEPVGCGVLKKKPKNFKKQGTKKPAVRIAVEPVECGVLKKKPKKFKKQRNERTLNTQELYQYTEACMHTFIGPGDPRQYSLHSSSQIQLVVTWSSFSSLGMKPPPHSVHHQGVQAIIWLFPLTLAEEFSVAPIGKTTRGRTRCQKDLSYQLE
ncbi:hypothetical protein M405DRAFT_884227 [Rhizopogon salebrosus TDB-379]|nr:hypothetical protein M405DRAFT_884227 [Rhizopogon salebrosus TDB-379]